MLIGFLGRAATGKSTAARHLQKKYNAKIFSFARAVKELAKALFEFSDAQVYGTQADKEATDPRYGFSPRTALIRLGESARHVLGSDVWVDALFDKMDYAQSITVIDDVRYPNEVAMIYRLGGYVIKLVCTDSGPEYPSEKSVDECSPEKIYKTIVSSKSEDSTDLKSKIDKVMLELLAHT